MGDLNPLQGAFPATTAHAGSRGPFIQKSECPLVSNPPKASATAEGSHRVTLSASSGVTAVVDLDAQSGEPIAIRLEGLPGPAETSRTFTLTTPDHKMVPTADASAPTASVEFSESGVPVRAEIAWRDAVRDGQPGAGRRAGHVALTWEEGELVEVRGKGAFAAPQGSEKAKSFRVFRERRKPTEFALSADASKMAAQISPLSSELPPEIDLLPGSPAVTEASESTAPDAALYALEKRGGGYRLRKYDDAVPAGLAVDDDGVIKELRIRRRSLPKSVGREEERPDYIYQYRSTDANVLLSRVDLPTYYFDRAQKKLDIRDPWAEPFGSIAGRMFGARHTLLNYDRLYTLWQAVGNVAHLDEPILEVGVFRGGSSALMAEAQRHFGKSGKIFACDTYAGHPRVDPKLDPGRKVGDFADEVDVESVEALFSDYPEITMVKGDIIETADTIDAEQAALIHLDVDLYEATKFCLERFVPRLRKGGMVVVDDYGFTTAPGVKVAVDDFVQSTTDVFSMHLLTGQALVIKHS